MKSAFISYQHDEREKVVRILNILTSATGADVWIDIDGLYVGDQYNAIIEREIQKREFFVFMASATFFCVLVNQMLVFLWILFRALRLPQAEGIEIVIHASIKSAPGQLHPWA